MSLKRKNNYKEQPPEIKDPWKKQYYELKATIRRLDSEVGTLIYKLTKK